MARHRRPVNVRDDGLTAVLGPLATAGGVEFAVLLDVDSGMVLDAWARGGEAETPDAESLGARHADIVRALLAFPGSPPAELALTVDNRHHLVRCVADPAGGRLALAVVVNGTPWVVRRVRRHLRQLPDAGLTTGPWILSWAVGPEPPPRPSAEGYRTPMSAGPLPDGQPLVVPVVGAASTADRLAGAVALGDPATSAPIAAASAFVGDPATSAPMAGASAKSCDSATPAGATGTVASLGGPAIPEPTTAAAAAPVGAAAVPVPTPEQAAVDGADSPASATEVPSAVPTPTTGPTATVPDPRRGPAPPSALPPARSGGR